MLAGFLACGGGLLDEARGDGATAGADASARSDASVADATEADAPEVDATAGDGAKLDSAADATAEVSALDGSGVDPVDAADAGVSGDCTPAATGLTTLASGQAHPFAIAVSNDGVFWTTTQGIMKSSLDGCSLTSLAPGHGAATGLVVAGATLYWVEATTGSLWSVPVAGGQVTPLAVALQAPYSITSDGANLFWADSAKGGGVWQLALGGTPKALATGYDGVFSVATEGVHVFWGGSGKLFSLALDAGIPQTRVFGQTPLQVTTDGVNVYWTDDGNLATDGAIVNASVMKAAIGDVWTPVALAPDEVHAYPIATDGVSVYWAISGNGQAAPIKKVPVSGGTPTVVGSTPGVGGLAVDATSLYWVDQLLGTVMKLTPK